MRVGMRVGKRAGLFHTLAPDRADSQCSQVRRLCFLLLLVCFTCHFLSTCHLARPLSLERNPGRSSCTRYFKTRSTHRG